MNQNMMSGTHRHTFLYMLDSMKCYMCDSIRTYTSYHTLPYKMYSNLQNNDGNYLAYYKFHQL